MGRNNGNKTTKEESENDDDDNPDDKTSSSSKRVNRRNCQRNKFSLEIFESLKAILDRPNPTKIWDAVLWALDQNPTMKEATELLDFAYAKYLSNAEDE